jgi:spore coat protein U-like protein
MRAKRVTRAPGLAPRRSLILRALSLLAAWPLAASTASAVNCTASAGSIAFGVYNPLNATALASTAPVTVQCSGIAVPIVIVSPVVSLSTGTSGSYTNRTLRSGSSTLAYNIYANVAHSQILGNGTGGSTTLQLAPIDIVLIGTGQSSGTLYGYLAALQSAAPGAYVDTITVTVSY